MKRSPVVEEKLVLAPMQWWQLAIVRCTCMVSTGEKCVHISPDVSNSFTRTHVYSVSSKARQ